MASRYTPENPFRLAVLGDSWVTEVMVTEDDRRQVIIPTGEALRETVAKHMGFVDFTIAGFPGANSWSVCELCNTCTVRNAAHLSAECYSLKRFTTVSQCEQAGLPVITDQPIVDEQLDVAIIVVGSNDIMDYAEQWAGEVLENLNEIRRLLTERGVEVLLCSLFLSEELQLEDPQRDRVRRQINQQLKHGGEVIDLDSLFRKDPGLWRDSFHLTDPGFRYFGRLLGDYVGRRFAQLPTAYRNGGELCQVHCDGAGFMARLLAGSYLKDRRKHHGKPVYKKSGVPGSADAYIFYCDARWGCAWQGWWLGPDIEMRRSCWAFHPDLSEVGHWWTYGRGLPRSNAICELRVIKVSNKKRSPSRPLRRITLSDKYWTLKAQRIGSNF